MTTRSAYPPIDPAADAAALLRRLGFIALLLAVPVTAMVSRRATVVLAPLGFILLILAQLIDGANPRPLRMMRGIIASSAGLAGLLAFGWALLTLLWTPFPQAAGERALNIAVAIVLPLLAISALPERTRSSNLYPSPLGVAAASLFAIGLMVMGAAKGEEGLSSLSRGLVVLSLLIWPALAWMTSRDRTQPALILAGTAALAIMLGPDGSALLALGAGAVVYGVGLWKPDRTATVLSIALPVLMVVAPVLPFLAKPFVYGLGNATDPAIMPIRIWADVIREEPIRLLTGYGLETALRSRYVGLLPEAAPRGLLFELWYELGLVGVCATAYALHHTLKACLRGHEALRPAMLASVAAAFVLACTGVGYGQIWWVSALSILVLAFVAASRGPIRTHRPKLRQQKPAP